MNQYLLALIATIFFGIGLADAHELPEISKDRCTSHTNISFEEADKDKDGTLDAEEAKLVCTEKFEVMDADHDGTVTKSELEACARKTHHHHTHKKSKK